MQTRRHAFSRTERRCGDSHNFARHATTECDKYEPDDTHFRLPHPSSSFRLTMKHVEMSSLFPLYTRQERCRVASTGPKPFWVAQFHIFTTRQVNGSSPPSWKFLPTSVKLRTKGALRTCFINACSIIP